MGIKINVIMRMINKKLKKKNKGRVDIEIIEILGKSEKNMKKVVRSCEEIEEVKWNVIKKKEVKEMKIEDKNGKVG